MPKTIISPEKVISENIPLLSTPAFILTISYVIFCVIIMLPFELKIYNEQKDDYVILEYNFVHRLLLVLFFLLPIILNIYSVNCMMVGNCTLWSYIVTFINVFWIVLFISIAFIYAMRKM